MSIDLRTIHAGQLVYVSVTGKLSAEDYQHFVPEMERQIAQHGKISLVLEMHDFDGWEAGALWEDVKFDWKHYSDFHRIAMIGDEQWESAMATICKPFTSADVKFFPRSQSQEALAWAGELYERPQAT